MPLAATSLLIVPSQRTFVFSTFLPFSFAIAQSRGAAPGSVVMQMSEAAVLDGK
jgi:hypothetical protein